MSRGAGSDFPGTTDRVDSTEAVLVMVRHGQTDLNRERAFRGHTEAPLNDEGRLQARGAAAILSLDEVDEVRTSPMRRALETALIIADKLGEEPVVDDRFRDVDYGDWQGLTVEEVARKFGREMLDNWRGHPDAFVFPGGESMVGVRERLGTGMLELAREKPGRRVVVVSHLAILKLCFIAALDLPFNYFWRLELENGAVSSFSFNERDGFVLDSWNRTISSPDGPS